MRRIVSQRGIVRAVSELNILAARGKTARQGGVVKSRQASWGWAEGHAYIGVVLLPSRYLVCRYGVQYVERAGKLVGRWC